MSHLLIILACSDSDKLANEIADCYGLQIAKFEKQGFSDGEFQISINETVEGVMYLSFKVRYRHQII